MVQINEYYSIFALRNKLRTLLRIRKDNFCNKGLLTGNEYDSRGRTENLEEVVPRYC
jgi:hypothetical protein